MGDLLAIDWSDWIDNPLKKLSKRKVLHSDYFWVDEITNSTFVINKQVYDSYVQNLQEYLSALSAIDCYENVWKQTKIPFGSKNELEIAIHLPYPRPATLTEYEQNNHIQLRRTRLVDHVLIRTGLYYSLYLPQKEEWDEIRKQLLQIECDFSHEIDQFLISGNWSGEDLPLDIVKAGAVKIKQYFLETNNIQEVRGASILLDEINQERIFELCKTHWSAECVIYSGGGNILIVLPHGEGQKCCREIELMYKKITISGQSIAQHISVSMSQLHKDNFSNVLGNLESRKTERQMTIIPIEQELGFEGDINYCRLTRMKEKNIAQYITSNVNNENANKTIANQQICSLCNKRLVEINLSSYKGEKNKRVCQSCYHKIVAGRNTTIYLDDMKDVLKNYSITLPVSKFSDSLNELNSDEIVLIYGDGNNMGAFVEKLASFQAYRYFSYLTDSITKATVYTTLYEIMKDDLANDGNAQFEILAVGGDDVLVIVPGKYGLTLARRFGEKFDQAFIQYSNNEIENDKEGMTLSVGVCIGHYKLPFATLFKTASELLKSAKAYKKNDDSIIGGTIDFMRLKSSVPYAGNLDTYRNTYFIRNEKVFNETVTFQQLLRPYTWKQVEAIECCLEKLNQLQNARNIIYKLRDISENMTIREAKLYFLYYMSVLNKNDRAGQRGLFKKYMTEMFVQFSNDDIAIEDLYLYDQKEKMYYSPYHDLAELWGYWR